MVKVFILYEREPDLERYERHVELCRQVPGAGFEHGPVMGAFTGEPLYAYYAEWEFPDMASFREGTRSEEFRAAGRDASEMGLPFTVHYAELANGDPAVG